MGGATLHRMVHAVIGVLAASGGLGTSTLTVALAYRAARRLGVGAAVDGQHRGGGLDTTAAMEHLPGLRWGDLAGSRGEVDGAAVLAGLPAHDGLRVLAAGGATVSGAVGRAVEAVEQGVERAVVEGLARVCPVTLVDAGRRFGLADACTDLVLVAGTTARQLADAAAVVADPALAGRVPHLVLRTGRRDPVDPEEVAERLDLPLAALLREDARVAADADRARVPGSRPKGSVERVADRVLEVLDLAGDGMGGDSPVADTVGGRRLGAA